MAVSNIRTPPLPPPPVSPVSQTPSTPNPPRLEEEAYKRIKDFLLWSLGIVGTLIVAISSYALFISYNNVQDMKAEYQTAVDKLTSDMKEIKADALHKAEEAKNASLAAKDSAVKTSENIKLEAEDFFNKTKEYSEAELNRVQVSTNQLALEETRKQLTNIFSTDRIQKLIQDQAVNEIKSKLPDLVLNETKDLAKIGFLGSKMNVADPKALRDLTKLLQSSPTPIDSLAIVQIFREAELSLEYYTIDKQAGNPVDLAHYLEGDTLSYISDAVPLSANNRKVLKKMYVLLNNVETQPYEINITLLYLSLNSSHRFHMYEIDKFNRWYQSLIK